MMETTEILDSNPATRYMSCPASLAPTPGRLPSESGGRNHRNMQASFNDFKRNFSL